MDEVKADVKVTEYTMDEKGNETVSESGIYMIISMLLGIIIWMFIMMFGGQVMSSVIEEKTSRVVEVLISSVKAIDLMFGKIIGVALVALTQFFLWIVLTGVLVTVATSVVGKDMLTGMAGNPEMMAQTMGVSPDQMQALGGTTATLGAAADSTAAVAGEPDEMSVIIGTLVNIPWVKLIVSFLIYFILGYLLYAAYIVKLFALMAAFLLGGFLFYASMFAAVGSAVENEGDSQQLQMPLTIPLMIAYFIILMAFQNPDSGVVVWGSMIPFTSPIVMPRSTSSPK